MVSGVRLVVDDLERGINSGEGEEYLRARLDGLPSGLKNLYEAIFEKIRADNYLDEVLVLIKLVTTFGTEVTLLDISFKEGNPKSEYFQLEDHERRNRINSIALRIRVDAEVYLNILLAKRIGCWGTML